MVALLLLVALLGPSLSVAQYTDYDSDYDSTIHDVSTNDEPYPCNCIERLVIPVSAVARQFCLALPG